jgi:hypothetical protein
MGSTAMASGPVTGSTNIAIGWGAGLVLTSGSSNTFVGAGKAGFANGAGCAMTTGSGNLILGNFSGNQGGLDIRTSDNFIVLSDGDGNPRGVFDGSGRFLIGTTSVIDFGTISLQKTGVSSNGISIKDTNAGGGVQVNFINSSGTQCGSISHNGTLTVYNTTSDYRLKTVVGAVTGHSARIDALEPIEYEWKSNGSRTRGFLAHKFQEVYADSVTGTKDAVDADGNPKYQSMQAGTSEVIADLVAEIQSLRKRLADAGI